MTARQSHRQRGFTLLEIMVSVTLLALLLTLAYASMRTASRAAISGEALIERSEEMRTAQSFLRRQLSQAMPIAYDIDPRTGMHYMFEGDGDAIRFVTGMPGYLSRGGPHVQRLAFVRTRDGLQLEFSHSQLNGYDPTRPIGGDRDPVVLVAGIADARFEFRTRDETGRLGPWTRHWEQPATLPQQLRLTLEFPREDPRHWPPLEIAMMSGGHGFGMPGVQPPGRRGVGRIQRPSQ